MKSDTPAHTIETLNDLIQLDYDAVKAFEHALERIEDPQIESDLEGFLVDHERHITDLSRLIRELGGPVDELGRDLKGFLLEGLTALRSSTGGTVGALKAMRTNERHTNHVYEKALALDLPDHARAVLAVHLTDERRHLATIEMHVARLARGIDDDLTADLADEAVRADRPHVRM